MERSAFEQKARTWREKALNVSRHYGAGEDMAEDIAQDVMLRLWQMHEITMPRTYGKVGHSPSGIYYMQHSYYGYYFSLQRSFLKDDRLTVRIAANAPFNKYWTSEAETVNGDYRDYQKSWNRARSFSLSVTWRFGSLKANVKKTEHSIENDDVVGGITKK